MAHEISWSNRPFFRVSARELNLGRICPFEFEDGFTRQLPEEILLQYFSGTKYEWLFHGTFWDRLQTSSPVYSTKHWCPKISVANDSKVDSFITIVNQTVEILSMNHLSDDIEFAIYVYYDAHVPLMCALEDATSVQYITSVFHKYCPDTTKVIQESNLPDIVNEQLECSFWSENKTKMKPIVHLMCKALPQRCQIRNLREIISNYCQSDDTVHEFMRSALLCSLLGMYKHCKKRLCWDMRKDILRRLVYEKPNRTQLQEWLFTNYQHLLFYTIKEFLTFSMPLIPALYDELCSTYKWELFENTVRMAMDNARTTIESNVRVSRSIQDWVSRVESSLVSINKQQLRNLYRPQRQSFSQTVINICDKLDEVHRRVGIYQKFPIEYVTLLRTMAQKVPRNGVRIEWLKYFNVQNQAIDSLLTMYKHMKQNTYRSELRKILQDLPRYDFEAIRALFAAFHQTHHAVRVFQLPKHYYDAQCRALRRRYGVSSEQKLSKHIGVVYVCLSCNSFKGFVVNKDSKVNNLFANGHCKIVVDDETLKCYCGKRSEKSDSKKRKRIALDTFLDEYDLEENRKRNLKKNWKAQKKNALNERCAHTEIVQINMTGVILQFYGGLYLFCPSCGNPTTFHPKQHDKHGFTCGQCMKEGTLYTSVSCNLCGVYRGKDTWTTVQTKNEFGNEETVAICNGCYKPWLKQYDGNIPFDIMQQQRQKCYRK